MAVGFGGMAGSHWLISWRIKAQHCRSVCSIPAYVSRCDVAAAATLSLSPDRKKLRAHQKAGQGRRLNMATNDTEESMDTGEDEGGFVKLPTAADVEMMTEDPVQVVLSIKWEEGFTPEQYKLELTKAFQTWVNTNKLEVVIEVEEASDSEASIKINPAPGGKPIWVLTKLREAKGQTLSNKNRKIVTLVSVRCPETQEPQNAPMNLPSPSVPGPQHELRRPVADSAAEEEKYTCKIPVAAYLYMNHIYKENIDRIAAENGVKIAAQVMVNFEPDNENGDPRKAMSEFRNLVQISLTQSDSLSIPLETTSTNTKPSVGEPTRSSYEKPQTIGMSIKDPLAYAGLDIEESVWSLMNTSCNEEVAELKAKFNVDLKESGIGQGQVNIKALYRRSEPNKSMESHAVRALLRLYQRIGTSPLGLTKRYGVSGFNSSLKTNDYQSEGASAGAVSKGPPGYNRGYAEEPTGGTVAVREEDANCPICMEKFTNKTQLKCGHEFCKDCLQLAKINSGPICPVCRDVFDVMKGDQPPGKMNS
ncbi:unnamed protein product [Pleuronectes platessa]|uniref:E3 ubiquitin-protein ligase n=1 Tax=Pleuronectes platessa TaxID=8262 RepID=A0A9N7W2U4_PLEPL|nr:unnamed protein product [Pleuronectes platessa]